MRLLFAGTPAAALPSLRTLLESEHEVVAVLTRPDAPQGRGRRLAPSPVKELALEAGLPVLTPSTLKDPAIQEELRALAPDAAPVVAYGALIPPAALDIPRHGWINLHFSLLPAWRGAAPAQRAVLSGAERTGSTVFRIAEGLDTGDVLDAQETAIGPTETAGALLDRMAEEGAGQLLAVLDALGAGTATATPQDHDRATHAPKLTPAEAHLDWTLPAEQVGAHIRGMSPDPAAWTTLDGARMKVLGIEGILTADADTDPVDGTRAPLAPGELRPERHRVLVGTGTVPLVLGTVAPAGKRPMRAADWARGAGLPEGAAFDTEPPTQTQTPEATA